MNQGGGNLTIRGKRKSLDPPRDNRDSPGGTEVKNFSRGPKEIVPSSGGGVEKR